MRNKILFNFCSAIIICLPSIFSHSFSQVNPTYNDAFLQNEIATIKVIIAQSALDFILDEANQDSNIEFPATFIYSSSLLNDTVYNVGFRLRGNTSRNAAKKSFKISFNEFEVGQKFKGLEKMNLNGQHNDVSIMRSKICSEILLENNLLSSRASYVKFYINNEYRGLYLNIEHIDDEFIQKRFIGNESGNLYKCNYGANLNYEGTSKSSYKPVYELKTNETLDDYSGLINFLNVLNNSSENDFPCAIEAVFDVDSYLKTAAFEILVGHWDGYIGNKNNFYLYQKPGDGKFHFIEYDVDNTFGVDWFNIDWSTRNIYDWSTSSNRPLFFRLINNDYYREQFTNYTEELIATSFNSANLISRFTTIQNLIRTAAHADIYRTLDYGFSIADFNAAINSPWGAHLPISLADYVENRVTSALSQVNHVTAEQPCLLSATSLEKKSEKVCIMAVDMLGHKIQKPIKNQILIKIYDDGSTEKTVYLD